MIFEDWRDIIKIQILWIIKPYDHRCVFACRCLIRKLKTENKNFIKKHIMLEEIRKFNSLKM